MAGIDRQLLQKQSPRILVHVQRFSLPTRPIQRRHQGGPETLPQRILPDHRRQLRDQLTVPPQCKVRIDPELHGSESDLLEPGDRGQSEALVGEIGQRRAPPQGQRLAQSLRCLGRETAFEETPPVFHQSFEAGQVEFVRPNPKNIAG